MTEADDYAYPYSGDVNLPIPTEEGTFVAVPGRFLSWPPGAPPREKVPQAGTEFTKGSHLSFRVMFGVPVVVNGIWQLTVLCLTNEVVRHMPLAEVQKLCGT